MIYIITASVIISFVLTGLVRKRALKFKIIDVPNHRSSHSTPTPRGGGAAIYFTFIAIYLIYLFFSPAQTPAAWAYSLIGGGTAIALLSFIDDIKDLPAKNRFIIHIITAFSVVFILSPADHINLNILSGSTALKVGVNILIAISIVWLLNLYNFMDGINGIASIEAITVSASSILLILISDDSISHLESSYIHILSIFALATIGFLPWNFPQAKIFLGDIGSCFLGISLATLTLLSLEIDPTLAWCWLILLGVFITDATITLLARAIRGENVTQAHKQHAYQCAARLTGSHAIVTLSVACINVMFLLPVAIGVALNLINGIWALAICYVPLIALVIVIKKMDEKASGAPERRRQGRL